MTKDLCTYSVLTGTLSYNKLVYIQCRSLTIISSVHLLVQTSLRQRGGVHLRLLLLSQLTYIFPNERLKAIWLRLQTCSYYKLPWYSLSDHYLPFLRRASPSNDLALRDTFSNSSFPLAVSGVGSEPSVTEC